MEYYRRSLFDFLSAPRHWNKTAAEIQKKSDSGISFQSLLKCGIFEFGNPINA